MTPLLNPGPDPKPSQRAVWTCPKADPACTRTAPCPSCLGRRNRRSGLRKQRQVRRELGVPDSRFAGQNGNEEGWRWQFRVECKSGQQVRAMTTRFLEAEAQAEGSRSVGDVRPFMFVAMPQGMSDGIVALRLSNWRSCVAPYLPFDLPPSRMGDRPSSWWPPSSNARHRDDPVSGLEQTAMTDSAEGGDETDG